MRLSAAAATPPGFTHQSVNARLSREGAFTIQFVHPQLKVGQLTRSKRPIIVVDPVQPVPSFQPAEVAASADRNRVA